MPHKSWIQIVKEVFPSAEIHDAALDFPITPQGWKVNLPSPAFCDWENPNYKLVINLQDMLTEGEDFPAELKTIHDFYSQFSEVDMNKIIVLVWPLGIKKDWNISSSDTFNIIEFSSHQYETWCEYKDAEDVLREAFSPDKKQFEFNYVCPQRIYKPHRAALQKSLDSLQKDSKLGNISLQTKGIELAYPSMTVQEYDETYNNLLNLLCMKKNYNTALFTIVSESQFLEEYGIITEKTFNAIVAGHPFLLCAHKFALENIKHYGFYTYHKIFDETYDEIDNEYRIRSMVLGNKHFTKTKWSATELQTVYDEVSGIIEYNRNWFFDHFGNQMVDELRMDLLDLWGK